MPPRARRRFGQHFLVDAAVVAAIVEAIGPQREDLVVEIGPGRGALTGPLLERLAHLHAIEIDRELAAALRARFSPERLTVHEGDALAFDFGSLGPGLRVVGNLPYNISTPLLFHLAHSAPGLRDLHVMLQKEVVERMVAPPGTPSYGRLSVMLQYRFAMEALFTVPPAAFAPAPKVESQVVRMVPREPPRRARDEQRFARVVAAAFAQRRKMLRNSLRAWLGPEDFARLGLDARMRAGELGVADFVRLADATLER